MPFRTIIEPFRIHSTQAVTFTTPEQREAALVRAGYNLFGLHGDDVLLGRPNGCLGGADQTAAGAASLTWR